MSIDFLTELAEKHKVTEEIDIALFTKKLTVLRSRIKCPFMFLRDVLKKLIKNKLVRKDQSSIRMEFFAAVSKQTLQVFGGKVLYEVVNISVTFYLISLDLLYSMLLIIQQQAVNARIFNT